MAILPFELIQRVYKLAKDSKTKELLQTIDPGIKRRELIVLKKKAKFAVVSWIDNPEETPETEFIGYTETLADANNLAAEVMVDFPEGSSYSGSTRLYRQLLYKRNHHIPKKRCNFYPYGEPIVAYKYDDTVSGVFTPFAGIENTYKNEICFYIPDALFPSRSFYPEYPK